MVIFPWISLYKRFQNLLYLFTIIMESIDNTEKELQIQQQLRNSQLSSRTSELKIPNSIIQRMKKKKKQQSCTSENTSSIFMKKMSSIVQRASNKSNIAKKIFLKTCKICEEQFPSEQVYSIGQCQHKFCKDCLLNYSIFKINMFSAVYCPEQICKQAMKVNSLIYNLLETKEKDKFKKISQYESIRQSEEFRLCPNELCQGIISTISQDKQIKCKECSTLFCSTCFLKAHHGNCDKYQLLFYQAGLQYRQCKKCKRVVQKIAGCDHIKCVCGYQFCYVCGRNWNPNHLCIKNPQLFYDFPCLRITFKLCFIVFFTLIVFPLMMLYFLIQLVGLLLLSVFIGIVIEPFIIIGDICHKNILLGIGSIFLFPILIFVGIFKAGYQLITQQFPEVCSRERFCSICNLISEFKAEQMENSMEMQNASTNQKKKNHNQNEEKTSTSKIQYESEDKIQVNTIVDTITVK